MPETRRTIPPLLQADALLALLNERPDVRLLDVRTPGEFETAHIRGAYNVPLDTLGEHAPDIQAHVGEPVVLICQSGARARRADEALRAAGMPNLHVLDGGLSGWLAAGLPAERGTVRMSVERQVRVVAGGLAAVGATLALLANPLFALLPFAIGSGLVFAGLTDTCALGLTLARMPWNRAASCDVEAMIEALKTGAPPVAVGRARAGAVSPPATCGG